MGIFLKWRLDTGDGAHVGMTCPGAISRLAGDAAPSAVGPHPAAPTRLAMRQKAIPTQPRGPDVFLTHLCLGMTGVQGRACGEGQGPAERGCFPLLVCRARAHVLRKTSV